MASISTGLNGNKTVTVTPRLKKYTITCGSGGTGQNLSVTVPGYGTLTNSGSYSVPYGTSYTASVTALTGYNVGTVSSASGTVTSNITITATAAKLKTYTATLASRGNSTVTIACPGLTTVTNGNMSGIPHGSTITVTATPDEGYQVDSISIA